MCFERPMLMGSVLLVSNKSADEIEREATELGFEFSTELLNAGEPEDGIQAIAFSDGTDLKRVAAWLRGRNRVAKVRN